MAGVDPVEMRSIARRLEVLESQNRRMKALLSALTLIAAGPYLIGAAPQIPKTLRAEMVQTDKLQITVAGKTWATLQGHGVNSLGFFDSEARLVATIGPSWLGGGQLEIMNGRGQTVASIFSNHKGGGSAHLFMKPKERTGPPQPAKEGEPTYGAAGLVVVND